MANEIQISETEARRFFEHIAEEDNHRIIFSAPYGYGKTTFLEEIVKQETTKNFEFYHLFPVNYSVGSNEDVFQYIKYDIITSMIDKEFNFYVNNLLANKSLAQYLKNNKLKVIGDLVDLLPKVGKDVFDFIPKLAKIYNEFKTIYNEDESNEEGKIKDFIKEIQQTGSLYELDIYTKIIQNILFRRKEETNKLNVLIIDDLDRIDPHHIFRLLNIFSAHIDYKTDKNKLGFDKIVFVCDLKNIRNIFRHNYGQAVDFSGYIDKFYSKKIYEFYNYEALKIQLIAE